MTEILHDSVIKRSKTAAAPPKLRFGELAFTDVNGEKSLYIGDANSNVYPLQVTDLAPASKDLNMNFNKIINTANAIHDSEVPNWGQVQGLIQGLKWRASAKVAVAQNVSISLPSSSVFDGVVLSKNDRILLMNQTNTGENGIYVYQSARLPLVRAAEVRSLLSINSSAILIEAGSKRHTAFILQVTDTAGELGLEPITIIPFANHIISSENVTPLDRWVLTSSYQLTVGSKRLQFLDPNGQDRDVILPSPPILGLNFTIRNVGSVGDIVIREDATIIGRLGISTTNNLKDGREGTFIYDGVNWEATFIG